MLFDNPPTRHPRPNQGSRLKPALVLSAAIGASFAPVSPARAGFDFKKGSFVKTTAGAPASQSVTGVGFRPKAVILTWTRQDIEGLSPQGRAMVGGFGVATGPANERAIYTVCTDNSSSSDCNGEGVTTAVIRMPSSGAPVVAASAELTSLDADGFTLNWTLNEAAAHIIHYVALGGSDVTNAVVSHFDLTTGTGSQAVSGLGFRPDFLLFLSHDGTLDGGFSGRGYASLGFASSATDEAFLATRSRDNVACTFDDASDSGSLLRPDRVFGFLQNSDAVRDLVDLTSFDPDGFTVSKEVRGGGSPVSINYLALRGPRVKVGSFGGAISVGSQAVSGVGFSPTGLVLSSVSRPADAVPPNIARGQGRMSFGAADGVNEGVTSYHDEDKRNTVFCEAGRQTQANTYTVTTKVTAHIRSTEYTENPTQAVLEAEADLQSFDADGFTLNWTTNILTQGDEMIYVAFGPALATAVELVSFEAVGLDGAVDLEWETGSELDNLGFHLYRATSGEGPFERITRSMIPGLGSSPAGARYTYRDTGLVNGVRYRYQLEDVETTGKTERHGPVSATPQARAGGGTEPGETEDPGGRGGTEPATGPGDERGAATQGWVRHGDPEATRLSVVERGRGHVVLELRTGGFWARPDPEGGVSLHIPGFDGTPTPGAPSLPVLRPWVEAVAGLRVRLASVVAHDVASFEGQRPAVTGESALWTARDGTVQAGVRRHRAGSAFAGRGLYPEKPASLLATAFQGETKKAQIALWPLRFDRSGDRLLLARRLVVRVDFTGREPGEDAFGLRPRSDRRAPRPSVRARLAVSGPGLYGVPFEDLFGRRSRGVAVSSLALRHQGKPVALHVEPPSPRFGPGSVLFFLSPGHEINPYGTHAVYELALGRDGLEMPLGSAGPSGGAEVPFYEHRTEREVDWTYVGALLSSPERWLWEYIVAGRTKTDTFALSDLAATSAPSLLEVWLQGASDEPPDPDHHLQIRLNGHLVAETRWDGALPHAVQVPIAPGILRDGDNTLEIENVPDAAPHSKVLLDRFALTHPRLLIARGGVLEGQTAHSGTATILGMDSSAWVLDTTETPPRWLTGPVTTPQGLSIHVEASRRYLAVSPRALLRPEVRPVTANTLLDPRNRAQYLLITPREFLPAAGPLLEHRRRQGLESLVVPTEEIYDAFGHGEPRPDAVRDFIAHAYHAWEVPPRYVLLLGDASYDFKDHRRTGVANRVPPFLIQDPYMWTVSDPAYAAVNGDDILPDLALGRLPAQTLTEAHALVQKLLDWENGGFDLTGRAVLVADNSDHAGDFEGDAETLAQTLLAPREVERVYLSQLGTGTRPALYDAFDHGASLVSYLGHGAIALWASENVFNFSDVSHLSPQPHQPFLMTMNCLNGYFHYPFLNSLAEELVKAEGKGAIGAFSPSSMSAHWAARIYHEALLAEIVSARHGRLGDALLAAQTTYADSGARPELLSVYQLLADPALRIR